MLALSTLFGMYHGGGQDLDLPSWADDVFYILIPMVVIWFVLLWKLFGRLEDCHPEKYEAMGSPSIFSKNNTGPLLKYLFAREHRELDDEYLSKLSDFTLVYFLVFLVFFLTSIIILLANATPHQK
jgi:hypothetical protein